MKHKEKLYFPDWNDCICSDIEDLKIEAKEKGLTEFDATEAVPENMRTENVYWCQEHGDFVDECDCRKTYCDDYAPNKSGRGVCKYRGCCYLHGTKKIHIKIK